MTRLPRDGDGSSSGKEWVPDEEADWEVVRSADDKRLTESQLLEMLGLESIQSLICKRKFQWVTHCARRGDEDLTWKRMVREVEDGKSKWGSRLKEDGKELGVNTVRGWCNNVKDRCWLASKLGKGARKKEGEKKPIEDATP